MFNQMLGGASSIMGGLGAMGYSDASLKKKVKKIMEMESILEMRKMSSMGMTIREIASYFNRSTSSIRNCMKNNLKRRTGWMEI